MAKVKNTLISRATYEHEMRSVRKKINESNFSTWQKKRFNQILDEMDEKLVVYHDEPLEVMGCFR